MTGRPRVLADRTCPHCGELFHPRTSASKYCAAACYHAASRGVTRGQLRERTIKVCPVCGVVFKTGGAENPKRSQIYCSQVCSGRPKSPPALRLARVDAAWLAGLFDGEGSIVNAKRSVGRHSLRITITNTCLPLLERVHEVTGTGKVLDQRPGTAVHARSWCWACYSDNARSLLRQMLPWLIVKKEKAQAELDR